MDKIALIWHRRNLRLIDNETLFQAQKFSIQNNSPIVAFFNIDPWFFNQPEIGAKRVTFLFESLVNLAENYKKQNIQFFIFQGSLDQSIPFLLNSLLKVNVKPALFNDTDFHFSHRLKTDQKIKEFCDKKNVEFKTFDTHYVCHEKEKMDAWRDGYYRYQKSEMAKSEEFKQDEKEAQKYDKNFFQKLGNNVLTIEEFYIKYEKFFKFSSSLFKGGETGAQKEFLDFLENRVDGYHWKLSRPFLAQNGGVSLLSPHIAFGTISTRQIYQEVRKRIDENSQDKKLRFSMYAFLDRIRWRESFVNRLLFFPEMDWKNKYKEFDEIYKDEKLTGEKLEYFEKWKNGETGFALLDAGMRQLKKDGWMNFRTRAMAVTFLTINCGVAWQHGARHFMNYLVDGDLAINSWQWQMQAGITNPLSPAFRIYDPNKNVIDRDPDLKYIHQWCPELKGKDLYGVLAVRKMLDFEKTKRENGKKVSEIRAKVRERLLKDKDNLDFSEAIAAKEVVKKYRQIKKVHYEEIKNNQPISSDLFADEGDK